MLEGRLALDFALELARMPTLASAMQARPLPPDTLVVIRIAAGCAETTSEAAAAARLSEESVKEAAILYLQKVLFAPGSDCHRILGVAPDAPRNVVRHHMRWLMRWLHPDRNPSEWESVFAARVLSAWREAGSQMLLRRRDDGVPLPLDPEERPERQPRNPQGLRQRWVAVPLQEPRGSRARWIGIAAAILFAVIGFVLSLTPAATPFTKWLGLTPVEVEEADSKF
jgi:hypothetical protein